MILSIYLQQLEVYQFIIAMNKNLQYASIIKDQYLPPPLQNNYLSLFDIQVKMAKQFLDGTDSQKMHIIKKRIKKFFDYGNDSIQKNSLEFQSNLNFKSKSQYPPFQTGHNTVLDNLNIDSSKIILYGKQSATFLIAEKLFSGFIGYDKIDDCNVKLSFATSKECQDILINITKQKGVLITQNIRNPYQIQWFELDINQQQDYINQQVYYARFVTNKDDILFSNDKYFRKLLGKARQIIDQQKQNQQKIKYQRKKNFFIKKISAGSKKKLNLLNKSIQIYQDFDQTITNYDGVYSDKSFQKYINSRKYSQTQLSQNQTGTKNIDCDQRNLSIIKYQNGFLSDNFKRNNQRLAHKYIGNPQKKKKNEAFEINLRQRLIEDYRKKYSKQKNILQKSIEFGK